VDRGGGGRRRGSGRRDGALRVDHRRGQQ
jgi:hypothetical protein